MFDLNKWTWWIPEDKMISILELLEKIKVSEKVCNGDMLSINGKLTHYMDLVPGGAWQRGFLLAMQMEGASHSLEVPVTDLGREQAVWWLDHIRAAAERSTIKDTRHIESVCTKKIYTDAAGGSDTAIKNGAGGFCPPNLWFYLPWPKNIRTDRPNMYGVKFAHKLSCLEGVACLIGLITIPDRAGNCEVEIITDNVGFVGIFNKKHSVCPYSYTIAKAIADVADGLACGVRVSKTKRVSGDYEIVADALSKGSWEEAWPRMPEKKTDPEFIPITLRKWLNNPIPDMKLGGKILQEMSSYTEVLYMNVDLH